MTDKNGMHDNDVGLCKDVAVYKWALP